MKILNRIPSIFKIASYQPKLMKGCEIEIGQCNSSKGNSATKYHSIYCSSANSRKMFSNSETEKSKSDKRFVLEDLKEENFEEVKELFRSYYYSREPQCKMLNLTYEDHKDLLHDSLKEWVGKNVSVIVKDHQTGAVVGCGLATILDQNKSSSSKSSSKESASISNYNMKVRYNLELDDILKNSIDLFKKYNVETILQLEIANVDPAYAKLGISKLIFYECEKKGKRQGCQLAYGVASNIYSQKALRSNGYTLECEIAFADMKIDGKQVLDLSKSEGTTSSMLLSSRL